MVCLLQSDGGQCAGPGPLMLSQARQRDAQIARGEIMGPLHGLPHAVKDLQAVKGKLIYRRQPRAGSGDEKSPIVFFDFAEREEKTILDEADAFEVTFDGTKLFVTSKKKYAFVDIKPAPAIPPDVGQPPATGKTTKSGIKWVEVRPGTGKDKPTTGDDVTFHVTGWNAEGRMLETTEMKNKPVKTPPFR